ncbi:YdgA family protein [Alysiella crassa]|uniref:Bacterial protein of uncharacterized function (DUF945) n=1 Tax=Alysiella crassa TaxID=153491 RepID=A0A376BUX9_9NEIS|nr:YdgA family protein [Alysiella crassa]SSY80822.1 Bacterial protein of uncharacterised function (DUF945) [Alysiella crassa]
MKKIIIGGAVPVVLAAFLGTPYYFGIKAQQSLEEQHKILSDTFFFDVVSHNYERGWFSSKETTVIRFHPTLLNNLSEQMPANIKTVLEKEITIVNNVKHGLFADGLTPVRASVTSEFQFDPEVQKVLSRFFNDKTPVTMKNTIYLSGSGKLETNVSPFEYEELSGIKLDWKGLNSQINYKAGFNEYSSQYTAPLLKAILADKGEVIIENIAINNTTATGKTGVDLGSTDVKVDKFNVAWKESIDYNIRLNELVNMVTDLQIGAFINPTGTIAPSNISVEKLSYQSQTKENDDGFVDSEGHFQFDKLHYGPDQYGPLDVHIGAEHLDGKSLTALKNRWQQIITEQVPEGQAQDMILEAVRKEGAGLFTNNPLFKIKKFDFTAPSGHIKVNGDVTFNGLQQADLNNFNSLLQKMKANVNFDISNKLLEEFAISQARGLFATEDPAANAENADPKALEDVNQTIRLMVSSTINSLTEEGYLKQSNNAIQTNVLLENNEVKLNGKVFTIQSDEEILANIEADDEPKAASAAQ